MVLSLSSWNLRKLNRMDTDDEHLHQVVDDQSGVRHEMPADLDEVDSVSTGSMDSHSGIEASIDTSMHINSDEVSAQLVYAGPVGVAAAAAIASARKRKRLHTFETNPSIRKRQQTRLMRKIRATIDEYTSRVGQQAIVMFVTPGKLNSAYKVFGAKPLEDVIRALRLPIMQQLEDALSQHAPPPIQSDPSRHELPPIVIDGIPTPVEKMTQAQLRAFIPLMLQFSTGRGKPGWGKEITRPPWWPTDVPWANVRMDARSEEQKQKVSWTHALRQIVINCYLYHGRDDMLPAFTDEDHSHTDAGHQPHYQTSSLTRHISNTADHIHLGHAHSTPTVADTDALHPQHHLHHHMHDPSSPAAHVEVHTDQPHHQHHHTVSLEEHHITDTSVVETHSDKNEATQFAHALMQTIANSDGSVSIVQMDPSNSVITLADGTQAHVQAVTSMSDALCSDGHSVNIDLSSVTEATINADGQLVLNAVTDEGFNSSAIVTIPINSSVYQTVVANIQQVQGVDGQTLQIPVNDDNLQDSNLDVKPDI